MSFIDDFAFSCSGVTSVTIPNSVTTIPYAAFYGCNCLTSITIPNSVTSIGVYAFYGTAWYNNQDDGVVYAGKVLYSFKGTMPEGTNIDIKDGTLGIADWAFFGCSSLKSVTIPNSLTSIGASAFEGCSGLTSISFPDNDISIAANAFYDTAWYNNQDDGVVYAGKVLYNFKGTMPEGTNIDIKDGTLGIADWAFFGCSSLKSVIIPNSLTSIGASAFKSCSGLISVTIHNNVSSIGDHAFESCSGLTSVTIPNSLTSISGSAFKGCSGLTSVTIPNNVTSIGDEAFSNCSNLTSVTIPNSLTSIGASAFESCTTLASINIPNSVTSIKRGVFRACNNLTSIKVEEGNPIFDSREDCNAIIKTAENELVFGCKSSIIPNSVTSIGIGAFEFCGSLVSIVIPNSVMSIGESAFSFCSSLNSVSISNSLTTIEGGVFSGCSSLISLTIPNNVSYIGRQAICNCESLRDLYCYAENVPGTENSAFYDTPIETVTLHVPKRSINAYKAVQPWNHFKEIVAIEEEKTDEEQIIISGAKQIPYCSKFNLDFTDLPELKAYVATGYDKAKGTIWLTRVKQVPAETGFLLIGDEGKYNVPTIDGVSDVYYKNMFKGTLEGTTIYTTDGDYTDYYLSSGASGVGFYKVTNENGVSIKANRAYLPILTDIPANGADGDAEVIKVSAAKQVPYYTSKNVDFTSLDAQGVKAYTSTGYNYKTGVIWLTRVKKVPAQTGILVIADEAGDYSVPTTSVQSVYENMFTGSETAQTIYTTETVGDIEYINYYLSNGASGIGFYKVTNVDGVSMGANRSYLQIPKRDSAAGARGMDGDASFSKMMISNDDDDVIAIPVFGEGTTGISEAPQRLAEPDVYYNLQGQRVDNPSKGLYIKNGRKIIVR